MQHPRDFIFPCAFGFVDVKVMAQRALAREVSKRKSCVHHGDLRCSGSVCEADFAALQERHAHSFRIRRTDQNVFDRHMFAWLVRAAYDAETAGAGRTTHGTVAG